LDLEKLGKLIGQWQGLIAAITLLGGAVLALRNEFLKLSPLAWSWPELAFALLAVGLVTFLAIRSRNANVSRLVDPDALKLDPQSPEQLVGRHEDLGKLLNALANPLVFLVSESGCGKSALLRAGVGQGTIFTDRFLPIYVDMSVLDWQDGPLRAVREGFSRSLSTNDPSRTKLDPHSTPAIYSEIFEEYNKRVQRRPLLLLDQFDDYQAKPQHRDRFLPRDTRIWRTADEISLDNAFWRVLRQCLQSDALSIIVACREDAVKGLESLRFHPDVPQFDLPRLEQGLVRMIIDRLTDRPDKTVIANPKGGWTALRDRLVDDLEARGHVLPQQLKLILGGLRTLSRLTPAVYVRAGRVAGLEAAFIAGALVRASRAAGLRDDEPVLQMLIALVDRTRHPPDKAPPLTTSKLAVITQVAEDVVARALKQLEADEVLRKRGDAEAETTAWQLDHAYLAQPILRIERERDQWRHLLAERAGIHAETAWRNKWGALLPVRTQIQLLAARLRGRFRYGQHRAYALKSLARGLPIVASFSLAIGFGWMATEYDAAARIETQLAVVEFGGGGLSADAAGALADLTTRGWVARWRVAYDVLNLQVQAGWFASRPEPILRALVRLDRGRLDALVHANVTPEALSQSNPRLRAATGSLVRGTSVAALTDSTRMMFEQALAKALSTSNVDVNAVASGIEIIVTALPDGDQSAAQWAAPLRDAIGKTNDSFQLLALAQAYAAVAGKLKDADPRAADVLAALRDAIGKSQDSGQLSALAQAYAAVAGKLKDADPRAADELAALRDAIGKRRDSGQLAALAQAYAAVAGKLKDTDPRAADVLAALRDAVGKQLNPFALDALTQAYAAVASKLKDADPRAAEELVALRDTISKEPNDSFLLAALAQAYAAVAGKLKDADPRAADELAALRDAVDKSRNFGQLAALAQAYAAVVGKLKDADPRAADVLAALRDAIGKSRDSGQLSALAQAYAAVAGKLKDTDPRAADVLAALRDAVGKRLNPFAPNALTQAYAAVASKLKDADPRAAEELVALRDTISKEPNDSFLLPALAEAYAAVAGKLKDADPRVVEVLAALRAAVGKQLNPFGLDAWARAYAAVAGKLKDADPRAADELAALRDAISNTNNSVQLGAFAQAYAVVARATRLTVAPARDLAFLLQRMPALRTSDQCEAFAAAIKEASQLGLPPLSWEKVGLVYVAALLEPVCAGEPSQKLVVDYENIIRQRADAPKLAKSWSGDVWAFATWAQDKKNLPGFDPHQPKVGFLPSVSLTTRP
jgi:hypothetical protein